MAENLERLKQRIPLMEYLQRHNWKPCRAGARQEFVGLCPLHQETHPSFYVNAAKNLFYCHGRGGDLIRFVQFFLDLTFHQTVALLNRNSHPLPFPYCWRRRPRSISSNSTAIQKRFVFLEQPGLHDPALIEEMGIGYAPGGNLRRHLAALGYSFDLLLDSGMISSQGRDAFCHRVIFPPPPAWIRSSTFTVAVSARRSLTVCGRDRGWIVCLGVGQQFLRRDPGRRAVRLGRAVAGRFS